MSIEVKLPELGDGIDSGDVLEVLVSEGDEIKKDQGILELETDKATVEVPSSHAGRVAKVHISTGDTIEIGQLLVTLEESAADGGEDKQSDGGGAKQEAETQQDEEEAEAADEEDADAEEADAEEADAEGAAEEDAEPAKAEQDDEEGQDEEDAEDEEEAPAASKKKKKKAAPAKKKSTAKSNGGAKAQQGEMRRRQVEPTTSDEPVPAGPAVRRFAREVGVDLNQVEGSGEGGRITREDVLEVVRRANQAAAKTGKGGKAKTAEAGSHQSDAWGPIRVEKMSKIRRTIAAKMHESWSTVPRVTNFDDADVTELERIRQSSKEDYKKKGIKLTSLPFLIKSLAMALRDHPAINATVDLEEGQITYKEYVNIGIAVDTPRGLVVPVLRDADDLSISEIARGLSNIAESVREGSFSIEDLRGATFTISNLGAIGGTYSTPIVNVPEVAILLVGRSRKMPVVVNDEVQIRLMMPLSLSYDHRLVDGAAAARFLNDVIAYLEAPSRLLLAP